MTSLLELPASLRVADPDLEPTPDPSSESGRGRTNDTGGARVLDLDSHRPGGAKQAVPRPGRNRLVAVLISRWPWLAVIAAAQVLLTRITTSLPGAFQDEGLYVFMGHRVLSQLTGGPELFEFPGSFFSGAPNFYPVLAALADDVGGLQAVRDLSLVMIIVTMVAVQGMTEALFGRLAGVLAAAAFAVCGSVIYLSQWATFDALTMMLAALAAWLAVVSTKRDGLLLAPVVGLILFASVYAKYAGAMFVPVVAGLAVAVGWSTHGWRIVRRALFMVATAAIAFLFVILLLNRELIAGLRQTTTARAILHAEEPSALALHVLAWVGPWLGVALIGGLLRLRSRPLLVLVLLGGSVLGPLQQIHLGEATSLSKHVAFGIVFAAVLIGDLLARMIRTKWLAVLPPVIIGGLVAHGLYFADDFRTSYSDDAPLIDVLRQATAANPGQPILGEQPAAQRYELRQETSPRQWYDTWELGYRGLRGEEAYRQAIEDHYFGVIYLDLSTTNSKVIFNTINADPVGQRYYHLVGVVPGYLHGQRVGSWLVWTPQTVRYTDIPDPGKPER